MVSRSAVRPTGTTGDTAKPTAAAAGAGADGRTTVRWGTCTVVAESVGAAAESVAESAADVGLSSALVARFSVLPVLPVLPIHARLRITEAPAIPIAAMTPSTIATAVPRAIICRW
jgi:hypothetical protein